MEYTYFTLKKISYLGKLKNKLDQLKYFLEKKRYYLINTIINIENNRQNNKKIFIQKIRQKIINSRVKIQNTGENIETKNPSSVFKMGYCMIQYQGKNITSCEKLQKYMFNRETVQVYFSKDEFINIKL